MIVNPNSSVEMGDAMFTAVCSMPSIREARLAQLLRIYSFNAPEDRRRTAALGPVANAEDLSLPSPASINNPIDEIQSAWATYESLRNYLDTTAHFKKQGVDAFLVACFSDHPLVGMLRHAYPQAITIHILQAALLQASATGQKFGILTTTADLVEDIENGVRSGLGTSNLVGHRTYVGTVPTGTTALELKTTSLDRLTLKLAPGIEELLKRGASSIILGCAAMPDLEALVGEVQEKMGRPRTKVRLISGVKAGALQLLGLLEST